MYFNDLAKMITPECSRPEDTRVEEICLISLNVLVEKAGLASREIYQIQTLQRVHLDALVAHLQTFGSS